MSKYLNKTQREIESAMKWNFKFSIPLGKLINIFKRNKHVKNSTKPIRAKRDSRKRR